MTWLLLALVGVLGFCFAARESSAKVRRQLEDHSLDDSGKNRPFWLADIDPLTMAKFRCVAYGVLVVVCALVILTCCHPGNRLRLFGIVVYTLGAIVFAGAFYGNWTEVHHACNERKLNV